MIRFSSPIRDVVIFGGTHGNEMSGVFLTRFWETPEGRETLKRTVDQIC
jgi:succinylglutamate desuccinylase